PRRLTHDAFSFEDVVSPKVHVRLHANPIAHSQSRRLSPRAPPIEVLALGRWQPNRPEENGPLPIYRREQGLGDELAGELGHEPGRDDVFFAFVFELNHREIVTKLGTGMDTDKILRARLAHGHRRQDLLDPYRVDEGLAQAKICGVEGVERRV